MAKKQALKTQEVIERLNIKYASPQYGFITQVRSSTGVNAVRTADAMAMSLWPSRGLHLLGFEVKVSRTDWLKELKEPSKAEEIAKYCNYWYIVVGDKDIIKQGELPQNWGLIVPFGKGLKIIKEAPFTKSSPIDINLMAGIFRNIAEQCVPRETLQTKFDECREQGKRNSKWEIEDLNKQIDRLKKMVDIFEKSSGVRLNDWNEESNKDIGKAVKAVLTGKDKKAKERLEGLLDRARNIVKYIEGEDISLFDC